MGLISNIATAFGLSTSAGVNAYLPLLVVALVAKYTSLISLNEPWNLLTSWWVIGVLFTLLIVEIIADKIPGIDHINDAVQSFIRPAAGAILFVAGSGSIGHIHPVLALIAGLMLAGGVHAVKATTRSVVTATTAGTGNWLVSMLEDIWSFITSICAILVPILGIILIVSGIVLLLVIWQHTQREPRSPE